MIITLGWYFGNSQYFCDKKIIFCPVFYFNLATIKHLNNISINFQINKDMSYIGVTFTVNINVMDKLRLHILYFGDRLIYSLSD